MSIDDPILRAAIRIIARHEEPEWRPSSDSELDEWGRGYFAGHKQGYNDAFSEPRPEIETDWPAVTLPGTGGRS